jgi:hypothetical protein
MKALTWHGKGDMRCEEVPDPEIEDGRDAIIKVTESMAALLTRYRWAQRSTAVSHSVWPRRRFSTTYRS